MKCCSKCRIEREQECFALNKKNKDGRHAWCKPCMREYSRRPERVAAQKAYAATPAGRAWRDAWEANPKRIAQKRGYAQDPEKKAAQAAKVKTAEGRAKRALVRQKPETIEQARRYAKERNTRPEIKQANAAYARNRRRTDPVFRLRANYGTRINGVMRGRKSGRKAFDILGYSPEAMRSHIESLFIPGMTWGNYGYGWHIDHIIPQWCYDFSQDIEVAACWALSNLRPLWKHLNQEKGDKIGYQLPDNWREIPDYAK